MVTDPATVVPTRSLLAELGASVRVLGEVLRVPDLRRAELAFVGFNMAEWATFIAVLVYAFEQGGAGAVGLVSVIQLVPAALFAPLAAVLGDRRRREAMLVVAYAVQVATMSATAAALLLDAPPVVVYTLATVTATGLTLIRPIHESLLPALARSPDELTAGYVADGIIENLSVMTGPAVAGAILAVSGPGSVYAAMAGALAISTILAARIRTRTTPAAGDTRGRPAIGEALAGFRVLGRDRRPLLAVGLLSIESFVLGILDVAIVVLAFEVFGSGQSGTGLLNAAIGAGALLGSAATVALIARQRLAWSLRVGLLLYGVPVALVAAISAQSVALAALAVAGAGMTLVDVAGRTMLQRLVPDETLARVFGVLEGAYMVSEAAGAAACSLLVVTLGVEGALLAGGVVLLVPALLAGRRLADADVGPRVPADHLALLHSVPIFAPLPAPDLERVAQHAFALSAAPGEVLIRQGDEGDRFYVIRSGTVAVARSGDVVARLGPGECFGEIALLRDVPRTATVTADTELQLLVLERRRFLEAVLPHGASLQAVDELIAARGSVALGAENGG
jgi:MFS family permease